MNLNASQDSVQNLSTSGSKLPSMTRQISTSSNLRRVQAIPQHAVHDADATWMTEGELSKVFVTASAPEVHSVVQQTSTGGRVFVTETRRVETPMSTDTQLVHSNQWTEDLPVTVTTNTYDTTYGADGTATTTCRGEGTDWGTTKSSFHPDGTFIPPVISNVPVSIYGPQYVQKAPQYVQNATQYVQNAPHYVQNGSQYIPLTHRTIDPNYVPRSGFPPARMVSNVTGSCGAPGRVYHLPAATTVTSSRILPATYSSRLTTSPGSSMSYYSSPTVYTSPSVYSTPPVYTSPAVYSTTSYEPGTTTRLSGPTVWKSGSTLSTLPPGSSYSSQSQFGRNV